MALNVGDKAVQFQLPATTGEAVSLEDFRGKQNVVLLFFPFAFSPVCTEEMCGIRDDMARYQELNAAVLGISVDSPFTLKAWAAAENLNFPLLSDFNKEVAPKYGAFYDELRGFKGVAKRAAFVVDKEGVVRYAWVTDDPAVKPSFEEIQQVLNSLSA